MYKLLILALLTIGASAGNLGLVNGQIKAHTEIFGDSDISPISKDIKSHLTMNSDIQSIRGMISIEALSLKSSKSDRDVHMYKVLNATMNPTVSFDIQNITKAEEGYQISGTLKLNGVSKSISSNVAITNENKIFNLSGSFSVKLTDYGMEQPTLLFLTVRNKIDITYELTYNKTN